MPFSVQTDYCLRTLMYLASRKERVRAQDVADFFQISATHVAKVVQLLARWKLIRSVRGMGGGIELSRQPDEIRLSDVVLASEGNLHLLECVGTDDVCVIQKYCKLRDVLNKAEQLQLEYLQTVRLSDVIPV